MSQHAATEQLLGTLRFRHWDGELLGSCSQLPSSPNTQRTLLSGDCSLFHSRPAHLHRDPASPTGGITMAVRYVELLMQISPLWDIKVVFLDYYAEVWSISVTILIRSFFVWKCFTFTPYICRQRIVPCTSFIGKNILFFALKVFKDTNFVRSNLLLLLFEVELFERCCCVVKCTSGLYFRVFQLWSHSGYFKWLCCLFSFSFIDRCIVAKTINYTIYFNTFEMLYFPIWQE